MSPRSAATPPAALALWAACVAPFLMFCLAPLGALAWQALHGLATNQPLLAPAGAQTLIRSLALSLLVAAFATTLGGVLGFRLGATRWPGKALARVALLMPLLVPPYLHAIGWTTLLRAGGAASDVLARLGIPPNATADAVYSFGGAALVLSLAYFPVATLFAEKSLAWSSPALVEAAQVFGAGPWRTFLVARWPFLRPAVVSAAMIIFLLAASDLGVPTILKVDVFNFQVFTRLAAFHDTRAATLLCAPLAFIALAALALERRVTRGSAEPDVDIEPPRQANRPAIWVNVGLVATVSTLGVLLPLGAILSAALDGDALTKMTGLAVNPALNTALYAGPAAMVLLVVSVALTTALRFAPRWTRFMTDGLLALGFAVPSTIIALGLLAIYDRPGLSRWVTPAMAVIAALVVRYGIVAFRIVQQSVEQIPSELFDAAATAGANGGTILRRIVLPMIRVPLLAVIMFGFLFAAGEIGSTILLHPPGGETLPIALYAIEANSPRSYVAALAVIQMGFLAGVLFLFFAAWRLLRWE